MKKAKSQKVPQKISKMDKQDLSHLTLSEAGAPEITDNTSAVFSPEITNSIREESFWGSKTGKMWCIGFICILLIAIFASFQIFLVGTQDQAQDSPVLPSPSPSITSVPSIIPSPSISEIRKSELKIKVLNGSGKKGEAAKAKTLLEKAGFTVADIGNAPTSNYKETILSANKQINKATILEIKKTLSTYVFADQAAELSGNEDADLTIIIGSEQK